MVARKLYRILVTGLKEESLGRPKHRWDDKIEMDFKKWGVDWIHLA
jgi:hypothetical protein